MRELRNPVDIMLRAAEGYTRSILNEKGIKGVDIHFCQGKLFFSVRGRDKAALKVAKSAAGDFLLKEFPGRKFVHSASNGYRLWWWRFGATNYHNGDPAGLRCGIEVKLTEAEKTAVLLGSWSGFTGEET